jgi:hypothetical protein
MRTCEYHPHWGNPIQAAKSPACGKPATKCFWATWAPIYDHQEPISQPIWVCDIHFEPGLIHGMWPEDNMTLEF